MKTVGDYTILEKLDETGRSVVFRARTEGGDICVIKLLKTERASATELARFRQEYDLIHEIDLPGVVRTREIITRNDGIAIVFEDFDGTLLKSIIHDKPIDIGLFLKMAADIAGTLGRIHQKQIVHGDINPSNIIVNRDRGIVKISDFGIARFITSEDQDIHNRVVIEGTLAYLSP